MKFFSRPFGCYFFPREILFFIGFFFCFEKIILLAAPPDGIDPAALDQIIALEKDKSRRTAGEQKMDSHFIYQLRQKRHQFILPGVTNFEPRLKFENDGRVLVDIKADVSENLLAQIRAGGGTIVSSVPRLRAIRAKIPLELVESLAAMTNVSSIQRARRPQHFTGSVLSQGDFTHGAGLARTNFGVDGTGVKVGVLSDDVEFLANSQASGDLPAKLTILPDQSGTNNSDTTGEGTAMLEIIYDLAPGAQLYFATADNGDASFAQNILDLQSNGCNIIVDDVGYFDESPFQDGVVAQAVNSVTANGGFYFSAAGNGGNLDAGTSATWEGDFSDGGTITRNSTLGRAGETGNYHNFGGQNYDVVQGLGLSDVFAVTLFWSDPLGASSNDYDLFVLNASGNRLYDYSDGPSTGTQDPYEICDAENNYRIVVVKYAGTACFLHVQLETDGYGTLSINTPGSIRGHNSATNAFAVAAADANQAYPNLFTTSDINEYFSADGPRRMFYQSDGTAITPTNFSSTGGALRIKPDLTAADGVATSVSGFSSFYGTSAAAPHAAAIAALLLSYDHALTASQLRFALTNSALDIGAPGIDRDSGAGIILATTALQSIAAQFFAANFQAINLTNGTVQLSFTTQTNHLYQVQVVGDLLSTNWINLGAPIPATNSIYVITDSFTQSNRFYRVQLLQ
jgi:subtilisin family serine protease